MMGATLLGVALVARVARARVAVLGGTYSKSFSSSQHITSRPDGEIEFERPRAYTQCFLVPLEIVHVKNHY